MTNKLYLDCLDAKGEGLITERLVNLLEGKGYRYGYSGKEFTPRKSFNNMPYITIDIKNGFYFGSKGADPTVEWRKIDVFVWNFIKNRLPDFGEITKKNALNPHPKHNNMLVESKDGRKMERVWHNNKGCPIGISRLSDDHLHNTILLVDRNIAEGNEYIGQNKDLANLLNELEDERIHRGLHLPLIPLTSLEFRKEKFND